MGAGLSSSAALENGVGFALNELFGLQVIDRIELVRRSQRAENDFVGAKVGIMDMFASMMGKANHVIKLDCRSLEYTYAPLQMDGIRIVLCDSRVQAFALVNSEYNTRRAECEAGVRFLQTFYPEIKSLRDVTMDDVRQAFARYRTRLFTAVVLTWCRKINACLDGVNALEANDIASVWAAHVRLTRRT